jgi:predicted RNA binding protein with dsRBD fold (UPF0201 family)
MDEISIHIETEVNPTEAEDKVKKAVENIFGNVSTEIKPLHKGGLLIAETEGRESLMKLYNLLRRERIRNAAKTVFLGGLDGKSVSFCLNKQVAYAGHLSFSKETGESPLGPIRVRIHAQDPRGLVNWLTAKDT